MKYFGSYHYQASVIQTLDSAIHGINHYPADTDDYLGNQLNYPVDRYLSSPVESFIHFLNNWGQDFKKGLKFNL